MTPFHNSQCRWMAVALLGLDAMGPRRWTGWLLGDRGSSHSMLSATDSITVYYLVLGLTLILFTRWRRVDPRRLFGGAPETRGVFAASCIGVAILLLMVLADNWLTPTMRAWVPGAATSGRRPGSFDGNSVAVGVPFGYGVPMTVEELKALPTVEKFQIMETLWEDLRARSDATPISQEIRDLLDSRRARFRSGVSRMHDWDDVRSSLGRA